MENIEGVLKYLYELGQLKLVKNSGWWIAKVQNPSSVAEHSFRAAAIAYIIAKLEKHGNPERAAVRVLLHDVHEARTLDLHKVASRYVAGKEDAERRAATDQCSLLGNGLGREVLALLNDDSCNTIAKDADYLEMALQAREYFDVGHADAWDWIERVGRVLRTDSAKLLLERLKNTNSNAWWQNLKQNVEELRY